MAKDLDFDILNVPMSSPKRRINDYSYCFYGIKKYGKTKLASMFPNSLFFGFEKGQNAIRARVLQVAGWKQFKDYVKALVESKEKGKKIPYKTFVIDTDDFATKYCTEYVCKQNGWSDPTEGEWGAGWRAVADEYWREIDKLEKLGTVDDPTMVIHLMHDTDKEFKPRGKEKYHKVVPNISGKISQYILDPIDFIVYCAIDVEKDEDGNTYEVRRLKFRGTAEYEAGSRLKYMPEALDYGKDEKEAYTRFCDAFHKAIIDEFGEDDADDDTGAVFVDPPKSDDKDDEKQTRRSRKDKTVTETPKVETPAGDGDKGKEDKPVEPKTENVDNLDLDELKEKLNKLSMKLFKAKKMTSADIVQAIKDNTECDKMSDVKDLEKAKKLYKFLEEKLNQ